MLNQQDIRLKKFLRRRYNRWFDVATRSDRPYQSHVPVLRAIAGVLKPRSVAEFGMGDYSTKLFLDRDLFPTVERLCSFENNQAWFRKIQGEHGSDLRFEPHLVPSPMWKTALKLQADEFDLIFVDDSDQNGRAKTMLALRMAKGITRGPVIVVHDVEIPVLRAATFIFPDRKFYCDLSPQTGTLCWASRGDRAGPPRGLFSG